MAMRTGGLVAWAKAGIVTKQTDKSRSANFFMLRAVDIGLSDLLQFRHAPNLNPFDDKNISRLIEVGAVRRDKLAGREMVARLIAQAVVARTLAEHCERFV